MKIRINVLGCAVLLLLGVLLARNAVATKPGSYAFLIFSAQQEVHSSEDAVALLKVHQVAIGNAVSRHFRSFPIQISSGGISEVETSSMEFLFEHAVCAQKGGAESFPLLRFPDAEGYVFRIDVPVVAQGGGYRQENGKIIVRVDKNVKEKSFVTDKDGKKGPVTELVEYLSVPASMLFLYVDQKGDVYSQP